MLTEKQKYRLKQQIHPGLWLLERERRANYFIKKEMLLNDEKAIEEVSIIAGVPKEKLNGGNW